MKKLLIFGGTTEGRIIAQRCADEKIYADICVTTKYGSELLPVSGYINVIIGKQSTENIANMIKSGYTAVVDATHPYAENITGNIRAAADICNYPKERYFRIKREPAEKAEGAVYLESVENVAAYLKNLSGKIFIATGSKELPFLSEFADRSRVRVLDDRDNIEICKKYGFDDIVTGKGPFTEYENLRDFLGCDILVTKDSGKQGGFAEKCSAAYKLGMKIIVIKRPEEEGIYVNKAWGLIKLLI